MTDMKTPYTEIPDLAKKYDDLKHGISAMVSRLEMLGIPDAGEAVCNEIQNRMDAAVDRGFLDILSIILSAYESE